MKISLKWLKDYVDITLPPEELAERLTLAGLEVSAIQRIGGSWQNVFVGWVVDVKPHPRADRLKLATVDLGGEQITVVCGAPNVAVGQKVAFARVGAKLIDGHTGETLQLQSAKIRGVLSEGMICSEKELGISDSHEGIMVLPADAPPGVPLADYQGDIIFDIEVTPNRPDCLSVVGIAREVAALTGQALRLPVAEYEERGSSIEEHISVEILDPDLCPRYCASLVKGVKIMPSPPWMQERLLASGMRPINNVVDVTNYVMLELGQPLHAFDYQELKDRKIIVRRAWEDEVMMSLDGEERPLNSRMLVIADAQRPVAIAGVMGGLDTEVTEKTTSVLLEAANFNSASLRHTSAQLRLRSEAVFRFEKGLNPELASLGLRRATRLFLDLAGGEAAKGIRDTYPGKQVSKPIPLSSREVQRLLGMDVNLDEIEKVLASLGFNCERAGSQLLVNSPPWRSDVHLPADLVEEVGRILGYERIPTTMLDGRLPETKVQESLAFKERVRDILVGCGMQEVITYPLTSAEKLSKVAPDIVPLRLANPMSSEQECLRTTLRPGILGVFASNSKYEEPVRLFEIGKVYTPRERDLPEEREILVGITGGLRGEISWRGEKGSIDFYDAKGLVETLLGRLGIAFAFQASNDATFNPGKAAEIVASGKRLGVMGELHPRLAEALEISGAVYLFELDLPQVRSLVSSVVVYQPLQRYPAVVRDIALLVENGVAAGRAEEIILSFPLVKRVVLFDLYWGKGLPEGKKSLAFRITYQSPNRTLTEEEVSQEQQKILTHLQEEMGATLRS